MKKSALIVLFFILSGNSYAQQSVGFEEPGNVEPVLEYRLPSWGYHRFLINLAGSGSGDEGD